MEQSSTAYLCHFGSNNINKNLLISASSVVVSNDGTELLNIAMTDITSVEFSANYIRINTNTGHHVIRGIKTADNTLLKVYRRSLSDPKALQDIRDQFKSYDRQTKTNLFIFDKKVVVFLLAFLTILAAGVLLVKSLNG